MSIDLTSDNLKLLVTAPEGIKHLKKMILSLALCGRLVPQDPNDEPASELFKKIIAEKKKLNQKGIIKEPKPLSSISPEDIPFEIPDSWKWVRLGEIQHFTNGFTFPSSQFIDNGIGVIRIGDIVKGVISLDKIKYIDERYLNKVRPDQIINKGDLVIAMSGATIGKMGFSTVDQNLLLNQRVGKLSFYIQNATYAFYYLNTLKEENLRKSYGSAIPNLSTQQINEIVYPLCPYAEQSRIVEKVDTLFKEIDTLEEQLSQKRNVSVALSAAALDRFATSDTQANLEVNWRFVKNNADIIISERLEHIKKLRETVISLAVRGKLVLQDSNDEPSSKLINKIRMEKARLVEDGKIKKSKDISSISSKEIPFKIPENWKWVRLGNVIEIIMGQSPPSSTYNTLGDGMPFYQGKKDFGRDYPTPRIWCSNPKKIAHENDILLCVRAPVGPTNICNGKSCIGRGLSLLRTIYGIDHIYLRRYMQYSESIIAQKGVGSTFTAISLKDISNFMFPLPPKDEQSRIVEKVDKLMIICDELEEKIKKREDVSEKYAKSLVSNIV